MKWRRAQPFQDGEWTRGGATNCPACYVGGIRPTVKARFGAQPADLGSAVLGAEATDGGFVLGNLPPKRVAFSGGFSDWIDFDVCGGTNEIPVCVRRQQGSWEWSVTNVQGRALAKFCVATSGPHKVYTVLAHPTAPWREAKDDPQCAWAYALEQACGWADGTTTTNAMMSAVTSNLFYNMGFRYDTTNGAPRYLVQKLQGSQIFFDLTSYISKKYELVNCYDQAFALVSMADVLGTSCDLTLTEPFGFLNPTGLIGVGRCNNPFFNGETNSTRFVKMNGIWTKANYLVPSSPLCDTNYVGRSLFGNHMYVIGNDRVWDSCGGPVLGTQSHTNYLESVIDYSTEEERFHGYHWFRRDSDRCSLGSGFGLK